MSRTYTKLTKTRLKQPKVQSQQYLYANTHESNQNITYILEAELKAELVLASNDLERRRVLYLSRQIRSR